MTFSLPIGDRIVGGEICSYPELGARFEYENIVA